MKTTTATPATGTLYWYASPGIVAESDLSGTIKSEYVFFNGNRVARRDLTGTSAVSYYFSDHLKTASVETDAAGNIKDESDFYPWGGELQFANSNDNHYKFTGKERDSEDQLDYFGARYYSSGLGRWISSDWSDTPQAVPYADFNDPQTLNLYGYSRSLPTTQTDLDGHLTLGNVKCYVTCKTHEIAKDVRQQQIDFLTNVMYVMITTYLTARNVFNSDNSNKKFLPSTNPSSQSTPADPNQQVPPDPNDPDSRRYEANPKHGSQQLGSASRAPQNGPNTLKNSVQIKPTSTARVGVDSVNQEIVVFREHQPGVFHGYVEQWSTLPNQAKSALIKAGQVTPGGKIIP